MDDRNESQADLWALIYSTVRPKERLKETPAQCVQRLTKERFRAQPVAVDPELAVIYRRTFARDEIALLDSHHPRYVEGDDPRAIVVVEDGEKFKVIDGNHRVERFRRNSGARTIEALVIKPTTNRSPR